MTPTVASVLIKSSTIKLLNRPMLSLKTKVDSHPSQLLALKIGPTSFMKHHLKTDFTKCFHRGSSAKFKKIYKQRTKPQNKQSVRCQYKYE